MSGESRVMSLCVFCWIMFSIILCSLFISVSVLSLVGLVLMQLIMLLVFVRASCIWYSDAEILCGYDDWNGCRGWV